MSTCENNNEVAGKTPKRSHWATASLILCLAGWVCALAALLICLLTYPASWYKIFFVCAIVLWPLSFIFGIIALVKIIRKRPVYRGVPEAIGGIVIFGSPLVFILVLMLGLSFLQHAFWAKPYDESHPASILATIEDNSVVRFPKNIEFLKDADKTGAGVFVAPDADDWVLLLHRKRRSPSRQMRNERGRNYEMVRLGEFTGANRCDDGTGGDVLRSDERKR